MRAYIEPEVVTLSEDDVKNSVKLGIVFPLRSILG
jgi:hypothetical protein